MGPRRFYWNNEVLCYDKFDENEDAFSRIVSFWGIFGMIELRVIIKGIIMIDMISYL